MEQTFRKGLTVGDVKGREFKVYERIKKYDIVEKIIIQFKKSKMKNDDYGVYKEAENGVELWMVEEEPLVLGSYEDAIDNLSFSDACSVATYLTNFQGSEFKVGRPNDRVPNA